MAEVLRARQASQQAVDKNRCASAIVSSLSVRQRYRRSNDVCVSDVEVNPGNSGGPVYRVEDQRVIGVAVAAMTSKTIDAQGNPVLDRRFTTGLSIIMPARYVTENLEAVGTTWA